MPVIRVFSLKTPPLKFIALIGIAICVLLSGPTRLHARAGGQWFELPPTYFFQLPDRTLTHTGNSLRPDFEPIPLNEYPAFGVKKSLESGFEMRRITDNNAGHDHGLHRYSKHQIWNADETVLDIGDRLIDANSLEVVLDYVDLSTARNWSYSDPQKLYGIRYVNGVSNVLVSYNYVTKESQTIYRFNQHEQCTFGSGEGNISIDERYVVVACIDSSSGQTDLLSVDIQQRKLLGSIRAKSNYNWTSIAQSGSYIVVENNAQNSSSETELVRYERDFTDRHVLTKLRNHSDLGRDVNGDDVIVMIDWDYISYIRLKDGVRVNLDVSSPDGVIAGHGHISCRNVRRPGWCYFSSYEQGTVGAIKIAQSDQDSRYTDNEGTNVVRGVAVSEIWGYHQSNSSSYQSAPKVTVSPTGSKLVFSSDWHDAAAPDDYMLSLPE